MTLIRITKEFKFEIAHALWNYDGLCKNMHGHSYRMFGTVKGKPIKDMKNPKLGMVIDFGNLKQIVNDEIVEKLDHAVILYSKSATKEILENNILYGRKYIVDYQPTCENMVVDIAQKISARLPQGVTLFSVKLHETANSFVEWFADDNN
ncbi:MAG: 6-carboxytetrahydropterin synthase [Bacteroidales bacterium]|jgi:6-pyruvoyltetrahydropterin/6-carboxytetrahydropterin synthase|nr:6-carboxytetrahydropterin synthase [Bacteroidales bacterium]